MEKDWNRAAICSSIFMHLVLCVHTDLVVGRGNSGAGECSCRSTDAAISQEDLRLIKTPVFTSEPEDLQLLCPLMSGLGEGSPVLRCDTDFRGAQGLRSPVISVQWLRNGRKLLGKTGNSLVLSDLDADGHSNRTICVSLMGNYSCVVSIAGGLWNITSRIARVTTYNMILKDYSLTVSPGSVITREGSTAVLHCKVSGKQQPWPSQPGQTVQWELVNRWGQGHSSITIEVWSELSFSGGGCQNKTVHVLGSSYQREQALWLCPLPDGSLVFPNVAVELLNFTMASCHLRIGDVSILRSDKATTITVLPAVSPRISMRHRRSVVEPSSMPVYSEMKIIVSQPVLLHCTPPTYPPTVVRFWVNGTVCHDSGYTNQTEWHARRLTDNVLILLVSQPSIYPLIVTCKSGYGFAATRVINQTTLYVQGLPALQESSFSSINIQPHCAETLSTPDGTFCAGPGDYVLPNNVTLSCPVDYVHSMPQPCVRWLRNGRVIRQCSSSAELVLQANTSDQLQVANSWHGIYQCFVANMFGEVQHTIVVHVPGKPSPPVLLPSTQINHHLLYKKPDNGGSPGLKQCFYSLCVSCDSASPVHGTFVSSCNALGVDNCNCGILGVDGCDSLCYNIPPSNTSDIPSLYNISLANLDLKTCKRMLHVCAQVSSPFAGGALSGHGPAITLPLPAPKLDSQLNSTAPVSLVVSPSMTTGQNVPIVNITVSCELCDVGGGCDQPRTFSTSGNHQSYPVNIPFPKDIRFGPFIQQKCTVSAASLTSVTKGETRIFGLKPNVMSAGDAVELPPSYLNVHSVSQDSYMLTWMMPPMREWNVDNLSAVIRYRYDNLTSDIFCSNWWQATKLQGFLPGKVYTLSVAAVPDFICTSQNTAQLTGLKWSTKTLQTPALPSEGPTVSSASPKGEAVTTKLVWMAVGIITGLTLSIMACLIYQCRHWKKGYKQLSTSSSPVPSSQELRVPCAPRPCGMVQQRPRPDVVTTCGNDSIYETHGPQFDENDVNKWVLNRRDKMLEERHRSSSPVDLDKDIDKSKAPRVKRNLKSNEGTKAVELKPLLSPPQKTQEAGSPMATDTALLDAKVQERVDPLSVAVSQTYPSACQTPLKTVLSTQGIPTFFPSRGIVSGVCQQLPTVTTSGTTHSAWNEDLSWPVHCSNANAPVVHTSTSAELKEVEGPPQKPPETAQKMSTTNLELFGLKVNDTDLQLDFSQPSVSLCNAAPAMMFAAPGQPLLLTDHRMASTEVSQQTPAATAMSFSDGNIYERPPAQTQEVYEDVQTAALWDPLQATTNVLADPSNLPVTTSDLNLELFGLRMNNTGPTKLDLSQPPVSLRSTPTSTIFAMPTNTQPLLFTGQQAALFPTLVTSISPPTTGNNTQPIFPASFGCRVQTSQSQSQVGAERSVTPEQRFLSALAQPFVSASADSGVDSPTYSSHSQAYQSDQSDSAEDDDSSLLSIEMQPPPRKTSMYKQDASIQPPSQSRHEYSDSDFRACIIENLLSSARESDGAGSQLLLPGRQDMHTMSFLS